MRSRLIVHRLPLRRLPVRVHLFDDDGLTHLRRHVNVSTALDLHVAVFIGCVAVDGFHHAVGQKFLGHLVVFRHGATFAHNL